ncbi:stromal cell-derived factor 1 isoform X2 [Calypte anna]|uniref:stromal cell-derived factor 1 isoform X2 n=2 Tax=Neoaves TaxID=3078114 RepID=UPI0011C462EA|nr:stromal cell-derived factor 1 isoform X2 [Calypte anna]
MPRAINHRLATPPRLPSPSPGGPGPSIEGGEWGTPAERSSSQDEQTCARLAPRQPPSMDLRALALLAFALAIISLSEEKPVSLTYRCPCRFYESNVARANIKHLKILSTPNCSLQIVARLKSNSKQVCIDPKLKWIQEYLEKALNKPRHRTHKKKQQKKRGPLCPSRATPLKSPGRKNGGSRCKRQAL